MQNSCKFDQNVLYLSCDGVSTDENGLIYMRARYYSPDMRRFINADVVAGDISNAITLNRFAYAGLALDAFMINVDVANGIRDNVENDATLGKIIWDANVDRTVSTTNVLPVFGRELKSELRRAQCLVLYGGQLLELL